MSDREMSAALSACPIGDPPGPARVLVVDDEPLLAAAIRQFLLDDGIEVHVAPTAALGFDEAVRLQPDVILMDLGLPDGDGLSLCRRLLAEPVTVDSAVIFMSADDSTERKVACLEAGATDYVTKPFAPRELRARVGAALRVRRTVRGLARCAVVDALTGLWNRGYLDWRMEQEVSHARRHWTPLACAVFDIDKFKLVNDRFGHQAGDAALRQAAAAVRATLRAGDVACRAGGDEIVVLLPRTTRDDAAVVAARIRKLVAASPVRLADGRTVPITCSAGVADYGSSGASMLPAADAEMYLNKKLAAAATATTGEVGNERTAGTKLTSELCR